MLTDFIAEWTKGELPREYSTYSHWTVYFEDSNMLAGLGAGVILISPTGDTVQYVLQIMYTNSNNAAEYEALLHGLRMATSMGVQRLEVRGDSNLAISQVNGKFDATDPKMAAYRNAVLWILARFEGLEFHHVARDSNQAADILARMAKKRDLVPKTSLLEWLFKPSVAWQDDITSAPFNEPAHNVSPKNEQDDHVIGGSTLEETPSAHEVMAVIPPWIEPLLAYLTQHQLLEDQTEA